MSNNDTAPTATSSRNSGLRFAFLAAVVLWCLIPMSPNTVDSDFWGHVQYGEDTLNHGLARESTYTFTAQGHRWINHENLSEIIFAVGVHSFGVQSLLILKCLMGCLVIVLMIRHSRRQHVDSITIAIFCVLVAINLSFYWGLRPHIFTFTYFAILIAWTEWCFDGWSGRWHLPWPSTSSRENSGLVERRLLGLWLCPILLFVWTNTHGGFLAGLAVYVAILGCRGLEYALTGSANRVRVVAHLSILAVAGMAATLINPYGLELHQWLYESLRVPRPEIAEWHPPDLFTETSVKLWLLLALTAIGLLGSRRQRDFTHLVVLGLVLVQALQHQRHLPFVAILIGFWVPVHFRSAMLRFLPVPPDGARANHAAGRPTHRWIILALLVICAVHAVQVGRRLSGVPVDRSRFPVSALQFVADQGITGHMVVSGEWAQYTLAVLGARTPEAEGIEVAFDGRFRTCYPQAAVDRHFDFFVGNGGPDQRYRSPESPPADPKSILVSHDPDLVLLNRHQQHAADTMQQVGDDWSLLYQDDLAQLWGRASIFDDDQSHRFVAINKRQLGPAPQTGSVAWPAAPESRHQTKLIDADSMDR